MRENFDAAFNAMLKDEGGYSNDPRDPGGMTNLGVTRDNWKSWIGREPSEEEMRALRPNDVKPMYKAMYWDKVWGDKLPRGLDYAMFDFAVNSGPFRAISVLQKLVSCAQDGVMGPRTFDAVNSANTAALIAQLSAARLKFLQGLSTYSVFGKGWSSRVARVQTAAQKMVA
jgi:lysozyme family protein